MDHQNYMRLAFEDARGAYAAGNRPVAALIVRDDAIIGSGRNMVYADRDPSAHAEVAAIRVACRKLDTLDLSGATLYSTLEPCPLCLWMILEAKIARVVLGARYLFAADGSNSETNVLLCENGRKPGSFGRPGRMAGELRSVHNMAIDSNGNIYTAEAGYGRRVQKFRLQ